MSKNKENQRQFDVGNVDPVKVITDHINKKGKLKGSKKEIKALKAICPHHRYNNKGKKKMTIESDGNGGSRCYICGKTFKADFFTQGDLHKRVNSCKEVAEQMKFIAQAIGAGKETVREVSNLSVNLSRMPKVYKKLEEVAAKRDKMKKKKNRNKAGSVSSSSYGGWGTNR